MRGLCRQPVGVRTRLSPDIDDSTTLHLALKDLACKIRKVSQARNSGHRRQQITVDELRYSAPGPQTGFTRTHH